MIFISMNSELISIILILVDDIENLHSEHNTNQLFDENKWIFRRKSPQSCSQQNQPNQCFFREKYNKQNI